MSNAGIFTLIASDGHADKLILATDLLNQRIKHIMCLRARSGYEDPTPTLVDIERTHILFVNAHYKPFAAIAFEYYKVNSVSGIPQFGSTVQFSIPQYGDFFSDMVVNATLSEVTASEGTIPEFPPYIGLDDQSTTATESVSATQDTVNGVYTKYKYSYVDFSGKVYDRVNDRVRNYVRYAEFPGVRLLRKVKFEVNANPLDEYQTNAMLFFQKFFIGPHKMAAWKRLVGQEIPLEGVSSYTSIAGTSNFPADLTNIEDVNGYTPVGIPVNAATTSRKLVQIVDGPQTPKEKQPELELWIPLLFWFNLDSRLAIPSVSIPYGQRFITLELESQNRLVFTAPGNLFLKLEVERQFSNGPDKGTAAAQAVERVEKYVTLTPVLANNSNVGEQQIKNMSLYINNLFTNTEIHDIYIKRIGFSLIRVHREQTVQLSTSHSETQLNMLKWPTETIFVGVQPTYNNSPANPNQYRDWHRFTLLQDNVIETISTSHSETVIDDTVPYNAVDPAHKTYVSHISTDRITYPTIVETVDNFRLLAHGIEMYKTFRPTFFSSYIPFIFGGTNVSAPDDPGAYMFNFCLYPGQYQPSGHINLSRAREFYIDVNSKYISPSSTATLIVVARAINFLLISDGSAVLRYST